VNDSSELTLSQQTGTNMLVSGQRLFEMGVRYRVYFRRLRRRK